MNNWIKKIEQYRIAVSGILIVFAGSIFYELLDSPYAPAALSAIVLGFVLAKTASEHFGHDHSHRGDSAIDAVPFILLLANFTHPLIDGFSLVQTFRIGGIIAGVIYLLSMLFHEILRQSAFASALEPLKIKWQVVVVTSVFGALFGVVIALKELSLVGRYHNIAELITLFSYCFIIFEFFFIEKSNLKNKKTQKYALIGLMLGLVIIFFMAH